MLDNLSDRLTGAIRRLSGQGRITESNVHDTMAEVRTALLDADVSLNVVSAFCDEVQQEALGEEVLQLKAVQGEQHELVRQQLRPALRGTAQR